MSIKTRLRISIIFSIALSLALGLILITTTQQANKATEKGKAVDDIVEGIFELDLLTFDYTLRPAERSRRQWESKYAAIAQLVASDKFQSPEELEILAEMRQRHENVNTLFSRLVASRVERGVVDEGKIAVLRELEERLVGQLSVETQVIFSKAIQLADLQRENILVTQRRVNVLATVIIVILVAVIAGTTYLVYVSIATPITYLTEVADNISKGNLDIVIEHLESKDEIGILARTFKQMTDKLIEANTNLEQRVIGRTRRLEILATLSGQLSAILNLEDLLEEVVEQIKDSFDYYHAHIYLLDDAREKLIVAAGTGPAGTEMKARGHNIPLAAKTSLVARAARTGEVVRVNNVYEVEDWLSNPLLPDTHSEMAVPVILEEQVVGVLDVQEDEVGSLDEGDASLLLSLANHIAIAMRNARLFDEVQGALAEANAAQERYLEQAWMKAKIASRYGQYVYVDSKAAPLDKAKEQMMAEARQQVMAEKRLEVVTVKANDSTKAKSLVAPIALRDKMIGALQLHTTAESQSWTEDDLAVIEAIVDQLAQSAENLRLFEDTRERAGREQTIREITDKLRAAPNLERLLEIATEELGQRLSATHAKLELGLEMDYQQE